LLRYGAESVSPNVDEINLDLKEAIHGLSGDRQTTLMEAAGQIHQTLGIKAHVRPGIGAWAVGAENSVMTETETSLCTKASALRMELQNCTICSTSVFGAWETLRHCGVASVPAVSRAATPARRQNWLARAAGFRFGWIDPQGGAICNA
jgi:hypothetical protein